MSAPKRIQLRRTKGWRKPEGAIVVARPSKWGNPFAVKFSIPLWQVRRTDGCIMGQFYDYDAALLDAIGRYQEWVEEHPALSELRGHDLACWCPLDQPCHADVLLELANR